MLQGPGQAMCCAPQRWQLHPAGLHAILLLMPGHLTGASPGSCLNLAIPTPNAGLGSAPSCRISSPVQLVLFTGRSPGLVPQPAGERPFCLATYNVRQYCSFISIHSTPRLQLRACIPSWHHAACCREGAFAWPPTGGGGSGSSISVACSHHLLLLTSAAASSPVTRPHAAGEGPCLATYWVRRYWQLLVVRILTGISVGGTFPLVFSLVGDLFFPHQRAGVAAGIQLATGAGFAAGQFIAGFVGKPVCLVGWVLFSLQGFWDLRSQHLGFQEEAILILED